MLSVAKHVFPQPEALRRAVGALAPPATLALSLLIGVALPSAQAQVVNSPGSANVLTFHNDSARTGVNLKETILKPTNVRVTTALGSITFGKLFSRTVDAAIYAQPLYVSNYPVTDTFGRALMRNMVLVATANNTIYAFDADTNTGPFARPYWQTNFNYPNIVIGPVPSEDIPEQDIQPTIGIVGTPVIDYDPASTDTTRKNGILYVLVRTKQIGDYFHHLHALDLRSGRELPGSPLQVGAFIAGALGDDSDFDGLKFNPLTSNQRGGLLLANGQVYIAWGAHKFFGATGAPEVVDPSHGWVMSYSYSTATGLRQTGFYSTSPDSSRGGISVAPSADKDGNIYLATGNGPTDGADGGTSFGNSILKLTAALTLPRVGSDNDPRNYFIPYNNADLTNDLLDLGSGGVVVLPDYDPAITGPQPGSAAVPKLAVAAGEEGRIYLLNRDNLGGFNRDASDDSNIVQVLRNAVGNIHGVPAYFNNRLYYTGQSDTIRSFNITNATLTEDKVGPESLSFGFPGAIPSVSADGSVAGGSTTGIVWAVETYYPPAMSPARSAPPPYAVLRAFDASDVSRQLYSSLTAGSRDKAGLATVFPNTPTIGNGKVYVGGNGELTVYGLGPARAATAERYLVTGPVWHDWLIPFPFPPYIEDKIGYQWSITAVGPDELPVKVSNRVSLGWQSVFTGGLKFIGSEVFNNESNIIVSRYDRLPPRSGSDAYQWVVADQPGVNKANPPIYFANIGSQPPQSGSVTDHFVIRAPSVVRVGQTFFVTIQSVTITNSLVPYQFEFVWLYNTNPSGTQVDVPLTDDGLALRPDFGYQDQYGLLTDPITMAGLKQITVPVRLTGKGKHVFIATDFVSTGTIAVEAR